jgi:NADPH:quinone reductase-like Zn-dependent oxidoreductase
VLRRFHQCGARDQREITERGVALARALGADAVIDYKKERFEDQANDLDMVFDLIDGDTRERS